MFVRSELMSERHIQRIKQEPEEMADLRAQLAKARRMLAEAEAELAQEQAAVNAFRMHCRLKLDTLVDTLLELRAQKQSYLTRLELLRQDVDATDFDESDDPLDDRPPPVEPAGDEEGGDVLLPTPTPRDKAAEKALYRELARRFHPDYATSAVERSYRTTIMTAVNSAYAENNVDALYDLAGVLSPEEAAELGPIEDREARSLREAISKMRRLRGKANRQLSMLREENTARLWRRAMALGDTDADWWSLVRKELEQSIDRTAQQVAVLSQRLDSLELEIEREQRSAAGD
jgi:hypothetical protein